MDPRDRGILGARCFRRQISHVKKAKTGIRRFLPFWGGVVLKRCGRSCHETCNHRLWSKSENECDKLPSFISSLTV
ncbi:hypothetical protein EQM14_03040 [Caproiciproducens sp. NJN-50]|nr:hypothetical protein EQM14_03040 [Caproiciproducens sp. NJN-50]